MAKWADYLISAVTYDSNHLILKIKQHTDNGKTVSQGDIVDRDTLANNLGHGVKYMTLYNGLEKVRIGKNVRYFRAYEHHYIRTDKNKVTTEWKSTYYMKKSNNQYKQKANIGLYGVKYENKIRE